MNKFNSVSEVINTVFYATSECQNIGIDVASATNAIEDNRIKIARTISPSLGYFKIAPMLEKPTGKSN